MWQRSIWTSVRELAAWAAAATPHPPHSSVVWPLCVIDQWRGCGVTIRVTDRFCSIDYITLWCYFWIVVVPRCAATPVCDECWHLTVYLSSRYEQLNTSICWLKALQWIDFRLAVLGYKCLRGLAPAYFADELHLTVNSMSMISRVIIIVHRMRLSIVGDQALPVTATIFREGRPQHFSLVPSVQVFRARQNTSLFLQFLRWL